MKAPLSLSLRVYAVAFLNLLLLGCVLLAIAHFEFNVEFSSILFAPARGRVVDVARAAALDLDEIRPGDNAKTERTDLMGRYRAMYKADFYVFRNDGQQLAGKSVTLPPEVSRVLTGHQPPPENSTRIVRPSRPPARSGPPAGGRGRRPPPPRGDGRPNDGPPGGDAPPRGGRPRDGSPRADAPPRDGPPRDDPPGAGRIDLFQVQAAGQYWVGARIAVPSENDEPPLRSTLVIAAPSFYGTPLFFDFKPWLLAGGAALAIFVLCWIPFIRGLTRTVTRLSRATEQIAEGEFDHHLPDERGDELGLLAVNINRMADRLSGFVNGQKRFLGDIAHELCAPIARMQFGLGILERRAGEDQRAAIEDVQDEMRQMTSLVNELLSFSKAGMRSEAHKPVRVDVANTVREAVARETTSQPEAVTITIVEPLEAMADREYLLRSVSNLLRNALRYAGADGPIDVSAHRENSEIVIVVADSGKGIPETEIDKVFSPFYRVETSRNRETGGVGLGLAIVRSCVEACNGRVQCRNRKPRGLEVEIRLAAA